MDLQLTGKRIVVTGGSQGIGLACARTFAGEGAAVVLVARDSARLQAAADELAVGGARVEILAADLSQSAERERLASIHGNVDVLVNNAGAIPSGGLLDLTMERWMEAWSLKVIGYIHLTQLYLRPMKAAGAGVIVNVIGAAGRSPRYDYVCGGTGNAALMAFTGAVGGRSVDWGVRVFGINPSLTRTERAVGLSRIRAKSVLGDEERWNELAQRLPLSRMIEPDEIARAAAFLASPACGYVSGTVLDVDGGTAHRS